MVEETLKPTDETGVKLAPEKPKKKPVEKPPEKEPDPSTTTTVLPTAPAGPAGLKGDVTVEAGNFEASGVSNITRMAVEPVTGNNPARFVLVADAAK